MKRKVAQRHWKGKPRGLVGRRPTGRRGELLSAYKQVTVRLPPETVAVLVELATAEGRPQWQIMTDAIERYAGAKVPR